MANDSLTFHAVQNREDVWGRTRTNVFDVTLSDSYPAGGYTLSPALVGMKVVHCIFLVGGVTAALTYLVFRNTSTGKLMIITNTSGLEVAGDTDLSTLTLRLRFEGE